MDPRGPLLLIVSILFVPVQLCEIPQGHSHLIHSLNVDLLRQAEDASKEPNPSLYLGLRLSANHNLAREGEYLQRLKEVFLPNFSRSLSISSPTRQTKTGGLALYLLALRAACQDMETRESQKLVTLLKSYLHAEKEQIGPDNSGKPITNYYQYSLGVLAMCVHNKKIEVHVINKLLYAENNGVFSHHGKLSIDTEAMAGLAFICLQQATFYSQRVVNERQAVQRVKQAVQSVKEKILQAQDRDGYFGNVYSSPLAVQFLIAAGVKKKPECPRGMAALFKNLKQGHFQNTLVESQLLPALYGKSYLDISSIDCQSDGDTLLLSTTSPDPSQESRMITVHLMAKSPPGNLPLYNDVLTVPVGSSLLDVLKAAEMQSTNPFRFETRMTLSGLMLTSVMGVSSQDGERKYWRLMQPPHVSLDQGIADYIPQNGDSVLLQFSSW